MRLKEIKETKSMCLLKRKQGKPEAQAGGLFREVGKNPRRGTIKGRDVEGIGNRRDAGDRVTDGTPLHPTIKGEM